MEDRVITRRDFIKGAAGTALTAALSSGIPGEARADQRSRVVLVRSAEVLNRDGKIQEKALQSMLDEAVKTLLEEKEPLAAWRKLFQPSDVVGIKSNSWRDMPTPKELEAVLKGRLIDVAIPEKDIAFRTVGLEPTLPF